ncbi:metal ABC transporter ATP-binding protein [Thermospira aquatica]|uniref:Metal ABC transporter ATP-binding protein n=1 Tax=Thermospira aquatica TaxID=2828656 RepID=A0AAX3BA83_9SPIR|nr:metal ABC transporter ATP-binding protein [Thermospira aquatica]URA09173.1 metal ABC transporter ATP-binding protein [Thermospira aquatica]
MAMSVAIEVKNLSFGYAEKPIVNNVSFSINEGEFVTLVGPNGGGKTTLLRLLLGLLQPWSGSILIYGQPNIKQRQIIGYVPQSGIFDRQFPLTVEEMVLQGRLKPWGWYTDKDKKCALEALDKVGLLHLQKETFSHLSGGQLQRVLIARALASEARILFLDEPSASIDSESEEKLFSLLSTLKREKTILLVTHDTGFINTITDRVLCIHQTLCEHDIPTSGDDSSTYGYSTTYHKLSHNNERRL